MCSIESVSIFPFDFKAIMNVHVYNFDRVVDLAQKRSKGQMA